MVKSSRSRARLSWGHVYLGCLVLYKTVSWKIARSSIRQTYTLLYLLIRGSELQGLGLMIKVPIWDRYLLFVASGFF